MNDNWPVGRSLLFFLLAVVQAHSATNRSALGIREESTQDRHRLKKDQQLETPFGLETFKVFKSLDPYLIFKPINQ